MIDPGTLNLVASLLIVLVMARVASDKWRTNLWWFGLYALLLVMAAVAVLLWTVPGVEVNVFLFGLAVVTGVYWTAATQPHAKASAAVHLASLAAATALTGILAAAAVWYRWWMAPLTLLVLMAVGLVVNGVLPVLAGWGAFGAEAKAKEHARRQEEAVPETPVGKAPRDTPGKTAVSVAARAPGKRPTSPAPRPAPAGAPRPVGKLSVRCAACGLAGTVSAARAGTTLPCPRCRAPVRVVDTTTVSGDRPSSGGRHAPR